MVGAFNAIAKPTVFYDISEWTHMYVSLQHTTTHMAICNAIIQHHASCKVHPKYVFMSKVCMYVLASII